MLSRAHLLVSVVCISPKNPIGSAQDPCYTLLITRARPLSAKSTLREDQYAEPESGVIPH